jgi:predicted metal-binding membrane protein
MQPSADSVTSRPDRATILTGVLLLIVAGLAWMVVWRQSSAMTMPHAASFSEAVQFTIAWGVMMTAMMLPAALPMILLYRTVRRGVAKRGVGAIPMWLFAAIYLSAWLLTGVPVYLLSLAIRDFAALPYFIAGVLMLAGIYQLTPFKRSCLEACESPMSFLMRRWRGGYVATARIAAQHAGYCIGCCWALMVVLVAAGAMSLPWVLTITVIVFVEKVLPRGWTSARISGVVLILLGVAIVIRPDWALVMRPAAMPMMH